VRSRRLTARSTSLSEVVKRSNQPANSINHQRDRACQH
jgi:hypothetical protein